MKLMKVFLYIFISFIFSLCLGLVLTPQSVLQPAFAAGGADYAPGEMLIRVSSKSGLNSSLGIEGESQKVKVSPSSSSAIKFKFKCKFKCKIISKTAGS